MKKYPHEHMSLKKFILNISNQNSSFHSQDIAKKMLFVEEYIQGIIQSAKSMEMIQFNQVILTDHAKQRIKERIHRPFEDIIADVTKHAKLVCRGLGKRKRIVLGEYASYVVRFHGRRATVMTAYNKYYEST